MKSVFSCALSLVAVATSTASAAVLINDSFDGYTSLTDAAFVSNYSLQPTLATNEWSLSTNTGLGGSQALLPNPGPANKDSHLIYKTPIDLATLGAGESAKVSLYFQRAGGSNTSIPMLGFIDNVTDNMANSGNNHAAMRINGASLTYQLRQNNATMATGSNLSLVDGNWYYMEVTMTKPLAGNITLSSSVYNADANGVLGSMVGAYNPAALTSTFSDSTVYAAVRLQVDGISRIDRFSVAIPEPSTYAALAGLLALGGVALHRRRSR